MFDFDKFVEDQGYEINDNVWIHKGESVYVTDDERDHLITILEDESSLKEQKQTLEKFWTLTVETVSAWAWERVEHVLDGELNDLLRGRTVHIQCDDGGWFIARASNARALHADLMIAHPRAWREVIYDWFMSLTFTSGEGDQ